MSPRINRFILIGSLLLNTFFISWAGTQWIKNRLSSDTHSLLDRTMQTVPQAARPAFLKQLRNNKEELQHSMQQFMSERQTIYQLSQQSELDSAALEQAITQARVNLIGIMTQLQSAMLAAMEEQPPKLRQEWVRQWVQHRPLKDAQLALTIEALTSELEQ